MIVGTVIGGGNGMRFPHLCATLNDYPESLGRSE